MKPMSYVALLLALGCTCVTAPGGNRVVAFTELTLNDGPADGGVFRSLYLQEGAVVDIVCKQNHAKFVGQLGPDRFDIQWNLNANLNPYNYPVDPDVFPAERNIEQYNSIITGEESLPYSYFLNYLGKTSSTLRYTARMEDNGKYLFCVADDTSSFDSLFVSTFVPAFVALVVRPAPAPLHYKSTVVHKWRGGFVGEINVPISGFYNSWKIILKFPRKVFSLSGGEFQVANEPCLHEANCGDDKRKTWVIYNTFSNRVLNPGDHLKFTFIADLSKKIDLGIVAKVVFYGFDQVFHTDYEPSDSSSDIHVL